MANFYRGVEYTPITPTSKSLRKFRSKGEYIYRGLKYNEAQINSAELFIKLLLNYIKNVTLHIQTLKSRLTPNLNMNKALFCHVLKHFPRLLIVN